MANAKTQIIWYIKQNDKSQVIRLLQNYKLWEDYKADIPSTSPLSESVTKDKQSKCQLCNLLSMVICHYQFI